MKWTSEAEAAIKRVPFFVRKKVRARVENEAAAAGKTVVSIEDVQVTQRRFLTKMSSEVKGYQVDTCFGPGGCPNRANNGEDLIQKIEALLKKEDLLGFLKQRVKGDLKLHHEFRVTLAECPNACSQPQIKDIGIIGAVVPVTTDEDCTLCEACVETCPEKCIALNNSTRKPEIDFDQCLKCGQCIHVCPTGTLESGQKGFRIQLGGKLGRHPRLARELGGIFSEGEVLEIVKRCVRFYKENSKHGERFAELFKLSDFKDFI
ncbi:4Fe-4S dicluster domain-containing protein [Thermodesulfobacteriota bacterium]